MNFSSWPLEFTPVTASTQPPAELDPFKEELIARIVKLETALLKSEQKRIERERAKERREREFYDRLKREALRLPLKGDVLSLCSCEACKAAFWERGFNTDPEVKLWCSMCHRSVKCCICRTDGEPIHPFPSFDEWLEERKKQLCKKIQFTK